LTISDDDARRIAERYRLSNADLEVVRLAGTPEEAERVAEGFASVSRAKLRQFVKELFADPDSPQKPPERPEKAPHVVDKEGNNGQPADTSDAAFRAYVKNLFGTAEGAS
jgi:hypothetical protein